MDVDPQAAQANAKAYAGGGLSPEDRMKILLAEMSSIQDIFDKYDDWIQKNRSLMFTIGVAVIGYAIVNKLRLLMFLLYPTAVFFFFFEGMIRFSYWFKYTARYRLIRDTINKDGAAALQHVYDLTNHFGPKTPFFRKVRRCFFKGEQVVFYAVSVAIFALVHYVSHIAPGGLTK